ncbi:hypothetical protein [Pseudomonas songnenensis]|uniref:Uncharacterized protein n=1 Tax=Pseudomonas songnenensis TaxID=1176259 RepID=A0A482UHW8_9PSED|nr:hypothetical protein [Pseudomonas songnenensis]RYJ63232.1 hypothetical protein EJA06_004565 [Pseudomonas songnenensis]
MIQVMNDIAMIFGYSVLAGLAVWLFIAESEFDLFGDVKKLIVFGIGPVWFRISETGPLYSNMRNIGFRIFSRGDWAFGLSLPRWLGKIVRRVAP